MKAAGISVSVISALVLVGAFAWHWSASSQLGKMDGLKPVQTDGAAKRGYFEGKAYSTIPTKAPISGDKVAWWRTETTRHWREEVEECTTDANGNRDCRTDWEERSSHESSRESQHQFQVRNSSDAVGNVLVTTTKVGGDSRNDSTRENIPSRWNERSTYLETIEYTLPEGEPVLLMGKFSGSGAERVLREIKDLPMVEVGTFEGRISKLGKQATYARWLEYAAIGGIVIGAFLLIIGGVPALRLGSDE